MDPEENLKQQLELANKEEEIDTERLKELVVSLDTWISSGGFLPKRWEMNGHGGVLGRALLAEEVYQSVFDATESLEGPMGIQLAYLMGAILKGSNIALNTEVDEEDEVLQLLRLIFPTEHAVWRYINVMW